MSGVDVLERILNCGESMRDVHDAVAELIEADAESIDTLDNLIHAMALPLPDAIHMEALRSKLPSLLEAKRAALARCQGGAA